MEYEKIIYEKNDKIATVTFNRPEARNAWSRRLSEELLDLFPKMEEDPEVFVVIITGNQAGKAFSAGADIADARTHAVTAVSDSLKIIKPRGYDLLNMIYEFPKPIIAAINGYALGMGFQVALCSDILIAAEEAEMGLPQVQLGILPLYGGSIRLARFVGKGKAMEMTLTSERINARDAHIAGLVQKVIPLEELMPTAIRVAQRIASLPPLAVRVAKESLLKGLDIPNWKDAAQADLYRLTLLEMTEDSKEAHKAWREKRQPNFKGK